MSAAYCRIKRRGRDYRKSQAVNGGKDSVKKRRLENDGARFLLTLFERIDPALENDCREMTGIRPKLPTFLL